MADQDKMKQLENYIHVNTVYYKNLLLDNELPNFQKDHLQGKLDMLKDINKLLFDGKAQADIG